MSYIPKLYDRVRSTGGPNHSKCHDLIGVVRWLGTNECYVMYPVVGSAGFLMVNHDITPLLDGVDRVRNVHSNKEGVYEGHTQYGDYYLIRCDTGGRYQITQANLVLLPRASVAPVEVQCQRCGRKNDQGVRVCWCCGQSPTQLVASP